jgi:hypothetical protein
MRNVSLLAVLVLSLATPGCPSGTQTGDDDAGGEPLRDASHDTSLDAGHGCHADSDCDDGAFCNGPERCTAGACTAGSAPCAAATTCDEVTDHCRSTCVDADGDGALAASCGGNDCDDANPAIHAGAVEVCDTAGVDEDCDPATFGVRDGDSDGVPDARCCNTQTDGTHVCGTDCDDARASTYPGAAEPCNRIDDDCDAATDEGVSATLYLDSDGDLHGEAASSVVDCPGLLADHVTVGDDCDDSDVAIHPGAAESCVSPADDDCDAQVDEGCICPVGDTRPCSAMGVCALGVETCVDGTAWQACSIAPAAHDDCNDLDDDCDGLVDEGVAVDCWPDGDNDSYAAMGAAMSRECSDPSRASVGFCPTSFTNRDPASMPDCCDTDGRAHPGQAMYFATATACGAFDYDCNTMDEERWPSRDATACATTSQSSCDSQNRGYTAAPMWFSGIPSCGAGGELVDGCTWLSIPFGGGTCTSTPRSQTQECR